MGINTYDVLEAASTKWNFLKFTPGLVGGHCISVDPYYLAYKSTQLGYKPKVITSGREVNEYMPYFVAEKLMRLMLEKGIQIKGSNILILGATFKENTPDTRNSKVPAIIENLRKNEANVQVYDPLIEEYKTAPANSTYDAIILAVPHDVFKSLDLESYFKNSSNKIILDIKNMLGESQGVFSL
jgi:UDP-N-acetyl-D-galactosamine dehydrogenase